MTKETTTVKKDNVSKVFLLPGIQIKEELRNRFNSFGFQNTYLSCEPFKYPFKTLFLLFRPDRLDMDFNLFVTNLQRNTHFVEVIDLNNGKVMLVYRIPREFTKDYDLFLAGKYSKLSDAFKACFSMEKIKIDPVTRKPIRDGYKYAKEPTNFYHIFNRTKERRDIIQEKYALEDDIMDQIEFFERQDPDKETLLLNEEEVVWIL
jgi:hypothetical protein